MLSPDVAQTAAPAATSTKAAAALSLLARVALFAGFLLVWVIQHGYDGIAHDSQLYTLPAVARIYPELLANDLMLRLGSQDNYTLFSPVYAGAVRLLGVDWAAALLTFVWQAGFFGAAAMLARRLMPERIAWLALACLCAIPAFYGKGTIFTVVEDFVTPRLVAEALVLAALTCFISQRYWAAGLIALAAASLHPLMAAAGVAVAVFMIPAGPRTRAWIIAGSALAAALALGVLAAVGSQLRFDEGWLRLLEMGTSYLFVKSWALGSITRATVMLGTLLVGSIVLEKSPARSLCVAALLAAIAGTAFSYIGGDLLHLVPVVQVQLWRWNWIANLLAVLFLPWIVTQTWSKGAAGRTCALLLAAAWLCVPEVYALEIMALVGILCGVIRSGVVVPERVGRQIFFGGCVLAGLAVLYQVATSILFGNAVPDQSEVPSLIQGLRGIARSGMLPLAAFAALAAIVYRARNLPFRAAIAAACVLVFAGTLPVVAQEWTREAYTGKAFQAFEGWRAQIPTGTEVLWFDSPVASWLLLQRPSYLSNQQMSSGLFSRAAAMEMKARVDRLAPFLATERAAWREQTVEKERSADAQVSLADLCLAAKDVKFVVSQKNLSATPIATTPPGASNRYNGAQLYRCPGPEG